jgi:predicted transcriptional regulator
MFQKKKIKEKAEARKLREIQGLSIKQIAKRLKVSTSSVSCWVRDINLTVDQKKILDDNFKFKKYKARMAGALANKNKFGKIRNFWKNRGKKIATKRDPLHMIGCMIYWCEGRRKNNKNHISFSNSDPNLLKIFINFLRKSLEVPDNQIHIRIKHYDDIISMAQAEQFWLDTLKLKMDSLRKGTLNYYSSYSKKKSCGQSKYGTCTIFVHRTDLIQHIYGALEHYNTIFRG